MTEDQIHILQIMTESRSYPRDSTWEREAIAAALAEIGRLEAEREALYYLAWKWGFDRDREEGEYHPDNPPADYGPWAIPLIREAAGLEDDAQVRAVLDQAARDTAAVAGRERAGEAIGGETMGFRVKATGER